MEIDTDLTLTTFNTNPGAIDVGTNPGGIEVGDRIMVVGTRLWRQVSYICCDKYLTHYFVHAKGYGPFPVGEVRYRVKKRPTLPGNRGEVIFRKGTGGRPGIAMRLPTGVRVKFKRNMKKRVPELLHLLRHLK